MANSDDEDTRDSYPIDEMAKNEGVSLEEMVGAAAQAERDGAGQSTVDEFRNQQGVEEVRSEEIVGTDQEPRTDSPW